MSQQLTLNVRLHDEFTFENYVGDAALRLQAAGARTWVVGGPGTGKTHLLQAACHAASSACYIADWRSLEPGVLQGLEEISLVALDDVDAVLGSVEAWELALFDLTNAIAARGGRLMIASRFAPAEVECLLPDVASRLRASDLVRTDRLDDDDKLRVLTEIANRRGFDLPADAGLFLISRVSREMAALVEMLDQLDDETLSHQRRLTVPFVKQVLGL